MNKTETASTGTRRAVRAVVPFVDLQAQHTGIAAEVTDAIEAVVRQSAFAGGSYVTQFERKFTSYCGTRYATGVGSGTEALWLALLALGVGPGDEVVTVAHTFFATAEAISMTGATPVFIDVDEKTLTMNPALIEGALTKRTKVVLPVHIYGQTADMGPIMDVARRHGLYVVEDASQAHGATYCGRKAGSIGDVGCFSFYPTKNLGAMGEAGAVVTNDPAVDDAVKMYRDHGQRAKHDHRRVGWNCRMDGIQAAVLTVKLRYLDEWIERRRACAQMYQSLLPHNDAVRLPWEHPKNRHVYHLYVIRVDLRSRLEHDLASAGVEYGIHYPKPVHLQEAYRSRAVCRSRMTVTEESAGRILSLPMHPDLSVEQIEHVADVVESYGDRVEHAS